jgi:hypothetical protein
MITITVNIDDKKSEKVVKAVLDALGLSYDMESKNSQTKRPLNKTEERVYNNMKQSLEQIKIHQKGQINLRDARDLPNEL